MTVILTSKELEENGSTETEGTEKEDDDAQSNETGLVSAMVLFSFTTIAERMILVSVGKNAVRDHYLSTTFLAVSIFSYTLVRQGRQGANSNRQKLLAKIGREYSADIYIVHPIIITILQVVFSILGLRTIYVRMAPMIVYMGTIVVISVTRTLKRRLLNI